MLKGIIYLLMSVFFMFISSILFAADSGYVERSKLMQNIRLEFSVLARMSREKCPTILDTLIIISRLTL